MLSRVHQIPERHGQTDGRTDRMPTSKSRVSVLIKTKDTNLGLELAVSVLTCQSSFHDNCNFITRMLLETPTDCYERSFIRYLF